MCKGAQKGVEMTNNQLKAQELRQFEALRGAQTQEALASAQLRGAQSTKERLAAQQLAAQLLQEVGRAGLTEKRSYDDLSGAEKARLSAIFESFGVKPTDTQTKREMMDYILNRAIYGNKNEVFDLISKLQNTINPKNWIGGGMSFSLRG